MLYSRVLRKECCVERLNSVTSLILSCSIAQMASGKLFHQQTADMESLPPSKKRKLASAIERPRGVASQFRQTDVSDVSATSKMFEGKEFCVVNGTRGLSKADAERKIAEVAKKCVLFEHVVRFVTFTSFLCIPLCFICSQSIFFSQHGGAFVQTPGPETFCVLVQKLIVRATSIIRLEWHNTCGYPCSNQIGFFPNEKHREKT